MAPVGAACHVLRQMLLGPGAVLQMRQDCCPIGSRRCRMDWQVVRSMRCAGGPGKGTLNHLRLIPSAQLSPPFRSAYMTSLC